MDMTGKTNPFRSPNFLMRLRTLIIVQCLFVFAALALILFYPLGEAPVNPILERTHRSIDQAARRLIDESRQRPTDVIGTDQQRVPTCNLSGDPNILAAVLFAEDHDSLTVSMTGVYHPVDGGGPHEAPFELASAADRQLLALCMREKPGSVLSTSFTESTALCYYGIRGERGERAVMAAVVNHDLSMSRRTDVMYAVFVLFLASLLLSLLTGYLVWKRFQQPLARLMHGLDKTAAGEMYSMVEAEGDQELISLMRSFNNMTTRLWEGRKRLEESHQRLAETNVSLTETERFLTTLIDNSPECVIVTSPDGKIVLLNQEATKTFGFDPGEIVGRPLSRLFNSSPAGRVLSDENLRAEDGEFEAIGVHRDQTSFPIFVVARMIGKEDGSSWGSLYLIRDISESKSFQEMMIRLDRYYTRGEMVGDIAHEINNYLAVLAGNIELLPIILRKGDAEKLTRKLELMRGTVDKIAKFTDGLMDSGHEVARFDPNDINQDIQNVVAFLKPQNKFDLVKIEMQLSPELPLVEHDAGQIQQLLVNLINNAAEAVAESKSERIIDISTAMIVKDQTDFTRIVVSDSGPGVLKAKEPLLFKKRFTTKPHGHGIGLITCRRIATTHHGDICYENRDGAVFTVDLPVRQPAGAGHSCESEQITQPTVV